jgi:hypothetical protein
MTTDRGHIQPNVQTQNEARRASVYLASTGPNRTRMTWG